VLRCIGKGKDGEVFYPVARRAMYVTFMVGNVDGKAIDKVRVNKMIDDVFCFA
jgi:hypothetical protein